MTFAVKVAGANFTNFVNVAAPLAIADAKVFHLFGSSAALSKRNYAGALADATIIGSPLYGAGFCTLTNGTNGFDSGVAGNSPFTHIAVCRKNASFVSMGNAAAGGTLRNLIETNGVNTVGMAVDGSYRATGASAAAGFQFVCGQHDGATAAVQMGSAGALTKTTGAYAGGTGTTVAFRVGANSAGTSAFDCAAAMTFQRLLTDAEVLQFYQYLISLLSTRGITVQ